MFASLFSDAAAARSSSGSKEGSRTKRKQGDRGGAPTGKKKNKKPRAATPKQEVAPPQKQKAGGKPKAAPVAQPKLSNSDKFKAKMGSSHFRVTPQCPSDSVWLI